MREQVDLVIGGGGSLLPALLAAAFEVRDHRSVSRVAGTSAGSIAAAAIAFGITRYEAQRFCRMYLGRNRLLDLSLMPFERFGAFKGDALLKALREVFPGRMGDARIPLSVVVSDMWFGKPLIISSLEHPEVMVADALRASCGIPMFFKLHVIGGPWGSREFADGGVAMNYAMDVFDDSERPTIGVRVRGSNSGAEPTRTPVAFMKGLARLMMWASDNAHMSAKNASRTIDIVTGFDSLDFDIDGEETNARWLAGSIPAVRALVTA